MEVRRIPKGIIKDKAEYTEHIQKRKEIEEELYWLSHTESPIANVSKQVKKCLAELEELKAHQKEKEKEENGITIQETNVENEVEKEKDLLHQIYLLQVKYDLLKSGDYESIVRSNLKNEIEMIDEFERKGKYQSIGKFLGGLLKGEEDAKILFGYFLMREYGRSTMPDRIDITPKSKVLFDFAKSYSSSWVDIDGKELEESATPQNTSLVVPQDISVNGFIQDAEEYVQKEMQQSMEKKNNNAISTNKNGENHIENENGITRESRITNREEKSNEEKERE